MEIRPIEYFVKLAQEQTNNLRDRRVEYEGHHESEMSKFLKSSEHEGCTFDNYVINAEEKHRPTQERFLTESRKYAENIRENIIQGNNILFSGEPATDNQVSKAHARAMTKLGLN